MNQSPFNATPPRLLLGVGLLFWGYCTGQWAVAVVLAFGIEIPRFYPLRLNFDSLDIRRAGQLGTILVVAAVVTAFNANEGLNGLTALLNPSSNPNQSEALSRVTQTMVTLFQWLPIIVYPCVWLGAWTATPDLHWRSYLWFLKSKEEPPPTSVLYPHYPYLLITIVGASGSLTKGPVFIIIVAGLCGVASWYGRSERYSKAGWSLHYSALILLTFLGIKVYEAGERKANELYLRWIQHVIQKDGDPAEVRTAIGSIGKIKSSGLTLFKVLADGSTPGLLRQGSYNSYKSQAWYPAQKATSPVVPLDDGTTWPLRSGTWPKEKSVAIEMPLSKRKGFLPLPLGAVRVENLQANSIDTNRLGFTHASEAPGFISFQVAFHPKGGIDAPADEDDLIIPASEQPVLRNIINSLQLTNSLAQRNVQVLESWFAKSFRYSLILNSPTKPSTNATPLARFLLEDRSGHCEYFATATCLLLRELKIPTRYAVGYAVQERDGAYYRVRTRHSHAWCLAFINGAWVDVDTTPADWGRSENANAAWWEPVLDVFSNTAAAFSKWRWGQSSIRPLLIKVTWSSFGLVLLLFFWRQRKKRLDQKLDQDFNTTPSSGLDSEFYRVIEVLEKQHSKRPGHVPLKHWINSLPAIPDRFHDALNLHYRHRFDPQGLTTEERESLRRRCDEVGRHTV